MFEHPISLPYLSKNLHVHFTTFLLIVYRKGTVSKIIDMVHYRLFGSIVYNRAIQYKRQDFLKVVVHVIIIDQCNQTAR